MSQIDLNYVVYHLHSDLSNGVTNVDSVTKFKEYIEKAKEFGMKAMAQIQIKKYLILFLPIKEKKKINILMMLKKKKNYIKKFMMIIQKL